MDLGRRKFLQLSGLLVVAVLLEGWRRDAPPDTASKFACRLPAPGKSAAAETNKQMLERVFSLLDPSLEQYLSSIPILKVPGVQTAFSHTSRSLSYPGDFVYVGVNEEWDTKAGDSKHWQEFYSRPPYNMDPEAPVFGDGFKLELLVHEFLHMVQDHLALDIGRLYSFVQEWYPDDSYGRPVEPPIAHGGGWSLNQVKRALWWNLYGQRGTPGEYADDEWRRTRYVERYWGATPGVEEFAYIGQTVVAPDPLLAGDRLLELSKPIFSFYEGILSPDILARRPVPSGRLPDTPEHRQGRHAGKNTEAAIIDPNNAARKAME